MIYNNITTTVFRGKFMRSSTITIITLLFIQLFMLSASAEGVYKWKDKYGKTQYGDKPPQGSNAQPLKMPAITVIENYGQQWKSNSGYQSTQDNNQASKPAAPRSNYSALNIVAPKTGQGIRANDGDVTLMLSIQPKLKKGHSIIVTLDGKQVSNGSSRAINLTNLDRGLHNVQAEVRDAHNTSLVSSPAVSFTVLRHSVLLNKKKKP